MKVNILKMFCPIIYLLFYALCAYWIYKGTSESVLYWKDCFQIVIGNLLFITVLIFYCKLIGINLREKIKPIPVKYYWGALIIPGAYLILMRLILYLIKLSGYTYNLKIEDIGETGFFFFNVLVVLMIAPVLEELLFRVCMIESYRSRLGRIYGLIAGTILFGSAHSNWKHRISAAFVGLILGIIYFVKENVFICILIHAEVNLFSALCGVACSMIKNVNIIGRDGYLIYVNDTILIISLGISAIGIFMLKKPKNKVGGA